MNKPYLAVLSEKIKFCILDYLRLKIHEEEYFC
jgi:hypothetical protein